MKNKILVLFITAVTLTTSAVLAAKYTVNTSGTVKNSSGQVLTSPANSVNQNYYNN